VEQQVHEADPHHGGVEVVAVEGALVEELPLPLVGELVAGEAALEAVLVGVALLLARVASQDVLVGPQEEAAGAVQAGSQTSSPSFGSTRRTSSG
jgi:hypothetical protein